MVVRVMILSLISHFEPFTRVVQICENAIVIVITIVIMIFVI